MTPQLRTLFLYMSKCISGCLLVFFLASIFHYEDFSWCMISVLLVLTPESKEAIPLAQTRIKANIIAGIVSLVCLLMGSPTLLTIVLAIILTILCCYAFNLMSGSRSATAAVIIIMLHGLEYDMPFFWTATIERVISVITGCTIGLLITLIFHYPFGNRKISDADKV